MSGANALQRPVSEDTRAMGAKGWRPVSECLAGSSARAVLIVALLTAGGAALRLVVAQQDLFGDELSTYWIVSTNGLDWVVSTVHTDAEITPPLYFVLAWLTTRIELTPEFLRAPSLLAGGAVIPLVYLLGARTVGRLAALVATALTALAPFMIFYSAEARAYQLMIVVVMLSTLALLVAVDDGRPRWWVAYGAFSCAAVYTHYTSVFALAAQLLWLLWAHPEARKPAILSNGAAIVAFLPWVPGMRKDFASPTTDILSVLQSFTVDSVRISLEHWGAGYPYAYSTTRLRDLPGVPALAMLALGVVGAVIGVALSRSGFRPHRGPWPGTLDRRIILVFFLAVSVPVGEAAVSAVGTNIFGTRNLAASWPAFALCLSALLVAARPPLRPVAIALVVGAYAIGATKMLETRFARPDFQGVADFIDRSAAPGDIVVDGAVFGLTPGPLSSLDLALDRPHRMLRAGAPQERDHPFRLSDPILPTSEVLRRGVAAADGRRLFVLLGGRGSSPIAPAVTSLTAVTSASVTEALPTRYRRADTRIFPGIIDLTVIVYDDRPTGRR